MLPETRKERDSVFAPGEIGQIIIAWVVLSLAISLSYVGGLPQTTSDYLEIVAAFIATGTGFILHEMGHKFTAMRLGYTAHFKIWTIGIALTLVTAVLTRGQFIFGAPGAVYIAPAAGLGVLGYSMTRSRNEDRDNMLISAAGPGVNLALAAFFLLLLLVSPATGFVTTVATYGFGLNVGLGSFNMLPIPPIDGYKIFKNNILVALAIALPLWAMFVIFFIGV
jgi:Zn-dependent protease